MFFRKILLLILLIFLFLLLYGQIDFESRSACRGCNVILISIDTLRADHLSLYGYNKKTSPNLDEWARDARVFENFYVNAPWTLPSHASMFASDIPRRLRMQTATDKFSDKYLTIAEVLAANGYTTIGWDSGTFVSKRWNFNQGFDEYRELDAGRLDGGERWQDADLIFPESFKWLAENRDKKFFMFLHTFQVHDPYCTPEGFDRFKGNYSGSLNCVDIETVAKNIRGEEKLLKEDLERFISLYDGEILFTDYYLGKLFDELKKFGLDKKTIVIITSDHGEEFGERNLWGIHSYSTYNELVHVPLIIKAPNLVPGRDKNAYSMIDIAPTILDLLGINIPWEFKGKPVRDKTPRLIYIETSTRGNALLGIDKAYAKFGSIEPKVRKEDVIRAAREAVILNGWKLIVHRDIGKSELYDLKNDKSEKNDLIGRNLVQEEVLKEAYFDIREERQFTRGLSRFLKLFQGL